MVATYRLVRAFSNIIIDNLDKQKSASILLYFTFLDKIVYLLKKDWPVSSLNNLVTFFF